MKFIKGQKINTKLDDKVFEVVSKCRSDHSSSKINASIGMLFNENEKLVTLESVYKEFDKVSWEDKARYADGIIGNKNFISDIEKWYINDIKLPHATIITPSGTTALSCCLKNFIKPNEIVILPYTTWDSYYTIFDEYCLSFLNYDLTNGNKFNLDGIKEQVNKIKDKQENIVLIINDPCHNPTGFSMEYNEWKELIEYANSLTKNNVIIINDVAYIEYSYNKEAKKYIELFNNIASNVLVAITISFSKSMTAYGMRLGAIINITKDESSINEVKESLKKSARGLWSNANNGAMICFQEVLSNPKEYLKEKQEYINLMKERSDLFIKYANEYNLPFYCYKEGFFVTIKVPQDKVDQLHEELINHHLYSIKVYAGIRIGICSTPKNKIESLVKQISNIYKKVIL